ncbi:MAG: BrnT family toxin [Xanthobacteraceae bacterium]
MSRFAMDFEWDTAKEQANRKKHGIDFRTATKVFLDPYMIEFEDLGSIDELRFNAIGLVDGRMLFVTYTMRGRIVRIISARGAEPHEKRKYHEV